MFMDMEIPDFQSRSNDSKNELISSTQNVFGDMCRWLFVRLFFLPPTSGPQLQMLQNKASSESPICGVFKRGE